VRLFGRTKLSGEQTLTYGSSPPKELTNTMGKSGRERLIYEPLLPIFTRFSR
jgi:hypothetical protein